MRYKKFTEKLTINSMLMYFPSLSKTKIIGISSLVIISSETILESVEMDHDAKSDDATLRFMFRLVYSSIKSEQISETLFVNYTKIIPTKLIW